jgi:hypothetical protein
MTDTSTQTDTIKIPMPTGISLRTLQEQYLKIDRRPITAQMILSAARAFELSRGTITFDDFLRQTKWMDESVTVAEKRDFWTSYLEFLESVGAKVERLPSIDGDLFRVLF